MNTIDKNQRIEEIELALSNVFRSPKAPAVSSYDEGTSFFFQIAWVVESHRDTTLDARCVATIRFSPAQITRYVEMDTANRNVVRERICETVRRQFEDKQNPPRLTGDCSVDVTMVDSVFEVSEAPHLPGSDI